MQGAIHALQCAWQFFSVEHPALGISYGDIIIGIFVVNFSIMILRPLLGIGHGLAGGLITSSRTPRTVPTPHDVRRGQSRLTRYTKSKAFLKGGQ